MEYVTRSASPVVLTVLETFYFELDLVKANFVLTIFNEMISPAFAMHEFLFVVVIEKT